MIFTVIISHFQRPELYLSLKHNMPFFEALDCDVIIATSGLPTVSLNECPPGLSVRVVERLGNDTGKFNKSEALNAAFSIGTQERILLLDADILLSANDAQAIAAFPYEKHYGTLKGIREDIEKAAPSRLKTRISKICFETTEGLKAEVIKSSASYNPRSFSGTGLLSMSKSAFRQVGGFCEELDGWGWEDVDIQARLQFAGFKPRAISTSAIHLTHDDSRRGSGLESKYLTEAVNASRAIKRYEVGQFLGTLSSCAQQRGEKWQMKT